MTLHPPVFLQNQVISDKDIQRGSSAVGQEKWGLIFKGIFLETTNKGHSGESFVGSFCL